jgi:beta-mannosidase
MRRVTDTLDAWTSATTPPGAFADVPGPSDVDWLDVALPMRGSDAEDHWFRSAFTASGARPVLRLGGLATVCDIYVDGRRELQTESMFIAHELPLSSGPHEIAICARALDPLLAVRRSPRARWRTKVVSNGNLRWFRTSVAGRAPGFAPGPPVVGPWRSVEIADADEPQAAIRIELRGRDGVVRVSSRRSDGDVEVALAGQTFALPAGGGEVSVPSPERWWPHTHGSPELYPLELRFVGGTIRRSCGFRELSNGAPVGGLDLQLNGVPVFVRGAVWTPVPPDECRATLMQLRDCGLNMVRVVGTMTYESSEFHDLCDELGMLVWQDLMFANLDYPIEDPSFRALVEIEVDQLFRELGGRPSLAVLCGNSEIEQQVAMLGLDPALGRGVLFDELIPARAASASLDVPYIPSAPCGGELPFRTNRGVANYFGVGAYLRPLEDVRRAEVQFASECLAFANVPEEDPADRSVGVMRDVGASWDFADVRDHYLRALHGVGPGDERYWEHARFVTGEVMAEVFGEWRRRDSGARGGIILWARDLEPGAGWGILDADGASKLAWHHLRRALGPVAVWMTDEGLNGIDVHVANDAPRDLNAILRISLYRDGAVSVGETESALHVEAHGSAVRNAEALIGHFVDINHAYGFGAPQQDVVVASLESGGRLLGQAFRFPIGRPRIVRSAEELGLEASTTVTPSGEVSLEIRSRCLAYGVHVDAPGSVVDDNGFSIAPNGARTVTLRPLDGRSPLATCEITALNMAGSIDVSGE